MANPSKGNPGAAAAAAHDAEPSDNGALRCPHCGVTADFAIEHGGHHPACPNHVRRRDEIDGDIGKSTGGTTWAVVDLAPVLVSDGIPAPAVLARDDGLRIIYQGRVHWLYGEPETCKSWVALL